MPTDVGATDVGQTASATSEAEALVRRLMGGGLYVKTGLLLLPKRWLGREGEVAARLNLGLLDYQAWRVARLRPGEQLLRYSAERVVAELDAICNERHEAGHLLVSNLDLPVASLDAEEQKRFWNFVQHSFSKRRRALLITFPQQATDLLPWDTELAQWKEQGRLALWKL